MMNHGLLARDLFHIRAAVSELEQIEQVILFGSRAKGTHERGSDVDIAIKGDINYETVLQLSSELNEARPLPYFFDVVNYDSLDDNDPLRAHIDRVGWVLFDRRRLLSIAPTSR